MHLHDGYIKILHIDPTVIGGESSFALDKRTRQEGNYRAYLQLTDNTTSTRDQAARRSVATVCYCTRQSINNDE